MAIALSLSLFVLDVRAQGPPASPALAKLERYVGAWTYDGVDKTRAGGAVACTSVREWIAAGYFLASRRDCRTPRGFLRQVEIFGYDTTRGVFTYQGFSGSVVSTYVAASADGPVVRWVGVGVSGHNRCTEVFAADGLSSHDQCETSTDGGHTWSVVAEGTSTRGN